jgi:hypothetical protein
VTTILVIFQGPYVVGELPLNVTVLVPWAEPKLVPVIVTGTPIATADVERLVMLGGGITIWLRADDVLPL